MEILDFGRKITKMLKKRDFLAKKRKILVLKHVFSEKKRIKNQNREFTIF